mgnify:CR=1 FL=1
MYLHLGQDFIVNTRDVIGVFDLDTATDAGQKAKITDEFLRHAQQEGAVVDVSGSDFPDDTVYITQISTAAIRNRAAKFDMGQSNCRKTLGGQKSVYNFYRYKNAPQIYQRAGFTLITAEMPV